MLVTFVIRMHKSDSVKRKDGKFPIVLQITWERKVRRKRLGFYASVEQWDFQNHEFAKGVHGRRENNQALEHTVEKAERFYDQHGENYRTNGDFDYKQFVGDLFRTEKKKEKDTLKVAEFCEALSKEFLKSNQGKSSEDYHYTAVAVLKVAPNDISFDKFDEQFLNKLKQYFIDKGVKGTNHFVRLRAAYGYAIERRIAKAEKLPFRDKYLNPFGFDINKVRKLRVTGANPNRIKDADRETIKSLYTYEGYSDTEEKMIKCYFFFSFFNFGVNLIDVAKLKYKHIKNMRWHYDRNKTGIGLKKGKPLLPEAIAIIEKYGRFGLHGDAEEYVFDIAQKGDTEYEISCKVALITNRIRHAFRRVCKRKGISGYLTYMSARYSAITLALNEGADRNTVSHLADHANFSTLDHYVGRADDEKVVKTMELLRLS